MRAREQRARLIFFMAAKLKFLRLKSWLIDLTEKPLAIFSLSVMGKHQEGKSLFSLFQSIKIGQALVRCNIDQCWLYFLSI
jgi:hypothetical protein